MTSAYLSSAIPAGRIFSFEPSPETFSFLQQNIANNGFDNCRVFHCAIGSEVGEAEFHSDSFSAGSHIVSDAHVALNSTDTVKVPVNTVDAFVEENEIKRLDFIKIDVEGFEYDVLVGMRNTLKKFRPIIFMEFNSWTLIAFRNQNPRVLLDLFIELFPYSYSIDENGELHPLSNEEERFAFLYNNLVNHRCVDDIVGSPLRLAIEDLGLKSSTSWKVTVRLRRLKTILRNIWYLVIAR